MRESLMSTRRAYLPRHVVSWWVERVDRQATSVRIEEGLTEPQLFVQPRTRWNHEQRKWDSWKKGDWEASHL